MDARTALKPLARAAALAALALALLAPPASATSVTGVSVTIYRGGNPIADPKAGENVGYRVDFNATNGLEDGDTITVAGPAGTIFPASGYQINAGGAGCNGNVPIAPARSNGNATVTVTEQHGCQATNGGSVALLITVTGAGVRNPTVAGPKTLSVWTSDDSTPATSPSYTIVPNDPAQLTAVTGDGQSTDIGQPFATALEVRLEDEHGNDIAGQEVAFIAPASGPSGSFAQPTPTTDSTGLASSGTVTANGVAGSWTATASVSGGSNPQVLFDLTNVDDVPPTTIIDGPTRTRDRTPRFTLEASEAMSTFECKLDGSRYRDCDSPRTTRRLNPGEHTLRARATDPAGNTGPAARWDFKVRR